MDAQTLHLFVEVMRRGSFADTARAESVDPSTISRTINALEEELGIRLFQRTTRRLSPTEAGLIYYQHVEPIVEELQRAREMALAVDKEPRGLLRVSAPATFGQIGVVPYLAEFSHRYPEVKLHLDLTDRYVDLVDERIDVAIRIGSLKDSSLIAYRLCHMPFVLCATPDYVREHGVPETPDDLLQHKLLAFPPEHYRLSWKFRNSAGDIKELAITPLAAVSNGMALYCCTLDHMGIGLLSRSLTAEAMAQGKLVSLLTNYQITPTEFDQAAWILYPSRDYLASKVRVFVDFMKQKFSEERGII